MLIIRPCCLESPLLSSVPLWKYSGGDLAVGVLDRKVLEDSFMQNGYRNRLYEKHHVR